MAGTKLSPSQRMRLAQILEHMRRAFLRCKETMTQLSGQYSAILGRMQRQQEQQKIEKILEEIKR